MMEAMDDLHRNKTRRRVKLIEMKRAAIDQGVASFCNDLKSLGELWKMNHEWMENITSDEFGSMESIKLEKLVDKVVETLHDLIKVAVENCERMYQDDHKKDHSQQSTASCDVLGESQANQNSCYNPLPTTSVLELKKTRRPATDVSFIPCLFRSLRRNAEKKIEPIQERLLEASKSDARPAALAQNSYLNAKAPPPPPPPPPPPSSPNLITNLAAQPAPQGAPSKISGTVLPKKSPPPPLPAPLPEAVPTPQPPKSKVSGTVLTKKASPPPPPPPHRPTNPLELAPSKISGAALTKKSLPPPPLPAAKEVTPSPPKYEPQVPENVAVQGTVDSEPAACTNAVVTIKAPPPAPPPLPLRKLPPVEVATGELAPLPTAPKIPRTAKIAASPPLPPAPPPLPAPSKGSIPSPSPPPPIMKGAPLPPPPLLGATKSLYPRKATTRLRRSTQIASLYRFLKGKIEGSNLEIQLNSGRNRQVGGSAGGKQGMADTIVEMKKRSAYFQNIEKDMQTHGKTIMDLKAKINSFQTKDMIELIKFRNFIESHLENLTDETQVLAKFEDFPTKKLEALRAAAALRLKLEAIVVDLQNWKIAPPLGKLLDQIENYFNKMKREIDTLERIKDKESEMFRRNNIEFNFSILVRIKELIVDISSRCMELALQESREAKEIENKVTVAKSQTQRTDYTKMLWRAFQFAFRVYSFAGGHDDHADRLSKELAHEIEASS